MCFSWFVCACAIVIDPPIYSLIGDLILSCDGKSLLMVQDRRCREQRLYSVNVLWVGVVCQTVSRSLTG